MSKLGIQGTLCTLVLFAAVAVFAKVTHNLSPNAEWGHVSASKSKGVLIADGMDPFPRPPAPAPPRVAS